MNTDHTISTDSGLLQIVGPSESASNAILSALFSSIDADRAKRAYAIAEQEFLAANPDVLSEIRRLRSVVTAAKSKYEAQCAPAIAKYQTDLKALAKAHGVLGFVTPRGAISNAKLDLKTRDKPASVKEDLLAKYAKFLEAKAALQQPKPEADMSEYTAAGNAYNAKVNALRAAVHASMNS